jgi:hypothetical protein
MLLLQSGGVFVFYGLKQYYVKQEMRERIVSTKMGMQKITLSVSEFQTCKINETEISMNGKMYDVKSVSISGNKVSLEVFNDMEEDEIIEKINLSINNSKQNKNQPDQIVQLLTSVYLHPSFQLSFTNKGFHEITFRTDIDLIHSRELEISSPPPRLV